MSIHLIRDLENLHRDILSMCANVEEMIHIAVQGLSQPRSELNNELIERDKEIDSMDVKIEEDCLKILALHQPVAIDLRRITTVMKIAGELERVADLAVNISERACSLMNIESMAVPPRLQEMAKRSLEMLHQSIDSYVELDSQLAQRVIEEDTSIDEMNRGIIDDLTNLMKQTSSQVEAGLHLFSSSRHIERIADHATNIAEDVVYLVEGEIIRHRMNLKSTT
ncbi:MAG: phosphate signaling complex protein PhoU [Planctomycetaceae bacterium]|nr:phosphate signaling complex protein PhoU [Planctomycetaceae bacterium]